MIELCVRSVAGEITLTHLVSVLREHSGEPGGREGAGGTFPGAAFSHSRLSQCPTLTPSYPHDISKFSNISKSSAKLNQRSVSERVREGLISFTADI